LAPSQPPKPIRKDAVLQAKVGDSTAEAAPDVMLRLCIHRYPEVDSLVMVQVKQIQEMGAYVKLVRQTAKDGESEHVLMSLLQLEYDNVEGMILLSELSRRRIRSIQKLIRVGRNEVVVVMRVDKEKGKWSYQY